jgi:hypothetical protein
MLRCPTGELATQSTWGPAGHSGWSPRGLTRDRTAIRFPCWWSNRPRGLMCASPEARPSGRSASVARRRACSCSPLWRRVGQVRADRTSRAVSGRHFAWTGGQLVLQNLARLSKDSATADCGTDANTGQPASRPLPHACGAETGPGRRTAAARWMTLNSPESSGWAPRPRIAAENSVQGLEPESSTW